MKLINQQLKPIPLLLTLLACSGYVCPSKASSSRAESPEFLLAKSYSSQENLDQYLVSEKLDGVRAYWNGKQLITRGGVIIQAPNWFTANFPSEHLDGELWIGRKKYDEVSGIVRTKIPKEDDWRLVSYQVFDMPLSLKPFSERYQDIKGLVLRKNSRYLKAVEQFEIASQKELDFLLEYLTNAKAEGLMLHKKDSFYQGTRSSDLLKYKIFQDAEARVLAHIPGRGQFSGLMGSILVETEDGRQFKIGTGFNHSQRMSPPEIGSTITYRYQGLTSGGLPRFASFLRVREVL